MQSALVRYLLLVVWVCTILEENHAFNCRALIPGRKTVKIMDTLVQPIMSNWLTTEPMSTLENNDATISLEDLSFDDETWQAYESAVLDFMESPRVLKKDKPEDLQEAKEILLSKCGLPLVPSPLTDGEEFGNRMKQQMDIFKGHYNLTKGQFGFLHRCLVYMGDHCAKNRNARPILVAWHKLKECGIIPRENCISTYMYILSTDKSCGEILGEVAAFHDVFFSPNEKTVTLRIKTLIGKNDVEKAEKVLASLSVRHQLEPMGLTSFILVH